MFNVFFCWSVPVKHPLDTLRFVGQQTRSRSVGQVWPVEPPLVSFRFSEVDSMTAYWKMFVRAAVFGDYDDAVFAAFGRVSAEIFF